MTTTHTNAPLTDTATSPSGTTPSGVAPPGAGATGPVPAPCEVPDFPPLRIRGGRLRPRLRRAPGALLLLTAAALALTAATARPEPPGRYGPGARTPSAPAARAPTPAPVRLVSAPVRIADAEAVRLLRAGDRVDVIAAPGVNSPLGNDDSAVRVVARAARVAEVPRPGETRPDGGALIVLSVPRATATALAGAGVTSQLAVTLC
ncbi:hypothetical protein [Streptomyces roseolus]|uniref:hypothetical protein n=1 Tax=Streptomyces roseolus TaxID=67358 RepID=UPI001E4FE1A3|nr:hypothetical protein [Streptomyces roseolus]